MSFPKYTLKMQHRQAFTVIELAECSACAGRRCYASNALNLRRVVLDIAEMNFAYPLGYVISGVLFGPGGRGIPVGSGPKDNAGELLIFVQNVSELA